jgi:peptidoglycan hydrolase-like protein with peptidoglycan-binding domain
MQMVEKPMRRSINLAAVIMAALLLASCAGGKFQWPWSKKPETVTEAPPPPPPPASKDDIRKVQAGLAKLGYRPGPADGIFGRKTKRAISMYQRKHGMPDNGEATLALLAHVEATLDERSRKQPSVSQQLPLPVYTAGAEYVYQTGEVDRVEIVRSNKKEVKWRRSSGETIIAPINFMLPRTYWESKSKRGKAILTGGDKAVWPIRTNEAKSFRTVKTVIESTDESNMKSREESWTCVNQGPSRLNVIAGVFDTVRFVCTRAESGEGRAARRIWHYAPEIRHYVRLDEFESDQPNAHRRELVAIRPSARKWPPVARAALERRLIATLNDTPVGGSANWQSSGISTNVSVKVTAEYFDPMGRQCRHYLQIWSKGSVDRQYPGVACREKDGNWRLPVEAGPTTAALSIASRPGS